MSHVPMSELAQASARQAVDAALAVHKALGPGLLESAYEHCLAYELMSRGAAVQRQVALPIVYGDAKLEAGYRLDLIVNGAVIVEIKSVMRSRRSTTRNC
jgi:GxxExxY protein